jgi:hypothetical protein
MEAIAYFMGMHAGGTVGELPHLHHAAIRRHIMNLKTVGDFSICCPERGPQWFAWIRQALIALSYGGPIKIYGEEEHRTTKPYRKSDAAG